MKTSVAYLTMLCCYVYYVDDSKKQNNDDVQHIQTYTYESGSPVGMNVTTTTGNASNPTVTTAQYYFIKNLQGDIVAMADATGTIKCSYTYDSWGKVLSTVGPNGTPSLTDHTNPANINPFRYRGYYYDAENQLYWLRSRFYDPNTGRFLNADSQLNLKDGFTGTNLFVYCGNNPIMFIDPTGHMPEWLQGTLNFIGGVAETAIGVGLGITAGWTGFGAVAAAFLIADGAARATQGIAQIVNDIAGSTILPEEHIIKAAFQDVGYSIAGDTGADIAGGAYDLAAVGATAYAGFLGLQQMGPCERPKIIAEIKNDIICLPRTGSAFKTDAYHAFPNIVDNYAGYATKTPISNGTLYQLQGSLNGVTGRFEWIVQNHQVTHRMFVPGGGINGIPIMP